MSMNVEKETAEALLDRGISIPIKSWKLPFSKRKLTLRLTMKRPCLGNLIKIARVYLSMNTDYAKMLEFSKNDEFAFMAIHGKKIATILTLTVLRNPIKYKMFGWIVRQIFLGFVRHEYMFAAAIRFKTLLGTKPFTVIIRSVEIANPLTPRLSQLNKGS